MFKFRNIFWYRKKYKPNDGLYMIIILVFAIIRCVPISCGSASLDDAFNDLAVGAIASTIVAWLIDIADCKKKNQDLEEKERMVFSDYCYAINSLGFYVAKRCKQFSHATDEFTLEQWLQILMDEENHPAEIPSSVRIGRTYFLMMSYVRNIKTALELLLQQYCILVESDIVDTNDFRQHVSMQLRLCNNICDGFELMQYDPDAVISGINNDLVKLESNARRFFPDNIASTYSWEGKG